MEAPAPASSTETPGWPRALPFIRSRAAAITIAGWLLLAAGSTILLGIITAEALYPAVYTTHDNEISDLGATRPPDSIILQPSAAIFDTVMIVTGAMLIAASLLLHRGFGKRSATIPLLLLGIGVLGVGVFPGDKDPYHGLFALLAFVAGGIAAILSVRIVAGSFRYFCALAGATTLGALFVAMLGDATPLWDELGDGGIERWVAYPSVLWMVALGGYLLAAKELLPQETGPSQT